MLPLLKGALLGFSIAAPVGPIGLLCLQRSINQGRAAGLACGLGAAAADAVYGAIAAFGVSAVSDLLVQLQTPLQLVGGLFLLYLGVTTYRQKPATQTAPASAALSQFRLFCSTWLLTLANPLTILSFAAVFAGLGLTRDKSGPTSAVELVAGVFLGSALWWCLLSATAAWLGGRLTANRLRWVNRGAGVFILGFAVWQLVGFLRDFA